MASSYETRCPKCGGRAHWNTDDGITYCDEPKCDYGMGIAPGDKDYRPPDRRGGKRNAQVHTSTPQQPKN